MDSETNKRLGELLIERGYINQAQLERAISEQKTTNKRLGELMLDLNYLAEEELIEVLEKQLGYNRIRLDEYNLESSLASYVPDNIAEIYNLVPFDLEGDTLKIAMVDPSNMEAVDTLKISTDYRIKRFIATRREINEAQNLIYSTARAEGTEPETKPEEIGDPQIEVDQPIPQLVQQIIAAAVKKKASDIHIEPEENKIRIRYRINGVLQEQMTLSRSIQDTLKSRIKVMAGMDITKNRIPQNGRIKIRANNFEVNSRVSSMPTLHGEKIVIRLLIKDENLLNIRNLGFSPSNLKHLQQLIEKPYGIVLVTGPTSSGKTTTLFASLNYLNHPGINIFTIEDPIEYQMKGIYQVQTSDKPKLNFPRALRSVMRQDPDVILVGEIRDTETAEVAIRAALTGHLVLSTMHTNDACSAIGRLRSLGIPSYLIHSTLLGVIAQRLVRTLCDCKKEYTPNKDEKEYLGIPEKDKVKFYSPRDCHHCGYTGYKGRTNIQEVLVIDDDFEKLILNEAEKNKIEQLARKKGFTSMKENARKKILQGITSYPEIKRVVL